MGFRFNRLDCPLGKPLRGASRLLGLLQTLSLVDAISLEELAGHTRSVRRELSGDRQFSKGSLRLAEMPVWALFPMRRRSSVKPRKMAKLRGA